MSPFRSFDPVKKFGSRHLKEIWDDTRNVIAGRIAGQLSMSEKTTLLTILWLVCNVVATYYLEGISIVSTMQAFSVFAMAAGMYFLVILLWQIVVKPTKLGMQLEQKDERIQELEERLRKLGQTP